MADEWTGQRGAVGGTPVAPPLEVLAFDPEGLPAAVFRPGCPPQYHAPLATARLCRALGPATPDAGLPAEAAQRALVAAGFTLCCRRPEAA